MTKKTKKGFTIIEVVLVLAIAGLIFAMVFIALPGLQRSQRDTQRTQDISRLLTAIQNYESNNRGAIPSETLPVFVPGHATQLDSTKTNAITDYDNTWVHLYDAYLLVGTNKSQDKFADPSGDPYSLAVNVCSGSNIKAGDKCSEQRSNVTFEDQTAGNLTTDGVTSDALGLAKNAYSGTDTNNTSPILILTHASCDNENAIYTASSRKVAVLYKKEGGGTICQQI